MEADAAGSPHAMYARLVFVVVSGKMSAAKSAAGVWKKTFAFPAGWQLRTATEYNARATGFAVITGPASGITAIDIDDPDTDTNKRLMRLMEPCTLVAKTKKGFHYVFRYDARILQTAGDKLDTRNAGGCIFVAPSVAYDDQGRTVAEYSWVRQPPPVADEPLVAVPEAVVDFLRALDRRYVVGPAPVADCVAALSVHSARPPAGADPYQGPQGPRPSRSGASAQPTPTEEGRAALMDMALQAARLRAGTDRVGFPTRIDEIDGAVRIIFSHERGTLRVCPLTRTEHSNNHYHVEIHAHERTGLPAFFLYCHSRRIPCNPTGHLMLAPIDEGQYDAIFGQGAFGAFGTSEPVKMTNAQITVRLGEIQKKVDRLLENRGGSWDTLDELATIACALCTSAARDVAALVLTRRMLDELLAASASVTGEEQKAHVLRGFHHTKGGNASIDPLMVMAGYAEGLTGTRDQELMLVREAIVANTDPALEANVPNAAEALLKVLEHMEMRRSNGRIATVADVQEAGLFVFYVWHRVARFSFNKWQTGAEKKHEFYFFNGATYEMGKKDPFVNKAVAHLRRVAEHLLNGPLQSRAEKLFERVCEAGDYVSRLTRHALGCMVDSLLLRECGLMSPDEFHDKLDTGPYIGFTNGVQDTERDVFMPAGRVGHNVLVSMTTHYAYVHPDDPRVPRMRAELTEYYARLFADDATDEHDAHLRKARLMVGSYLYPCNVAKKLHVYLGHEGNNGKSAFAESLRRTLGDYYVTGNISALTPGPRETLDVEIIRNHKALLCSFAEAQSTDRDGHSIGLKLDSGKLKVMTGNDTVCARGLYQNPRNVDIKNKPAAQTNNTPELDHNDPAASERVFVLGFGSRFSKTAEDRARRIYKCIPDLNAKLAEWAPFHFLLMMEWLRDFKAAGLDLPPGDQHTAGSFANKAVASQTPEGKVRSWVEANFTHVSEARHGTKLKLIYEAYRTHSAANTMGRNELAACLKTLYPAIKHRCAKEGDVYLIRVD